MTNLLVNPSFEEGWTDIPVPEANTRNQEPKGWKVVWYPVGNLLDSASEDIPDDLPHKTTVGVIPECIHKLRAQLPDADRLILNGDVVYKVFSSSSPFSVALSQTVSGLQPGARYAFTVPVQVHYHPYPGGDGSPGAAVWQIGLYGGTDVGSDWLTYHNGFEDREWATATAYGIAGLDGELSVEIVVESRSEAGIDFFIDDCRLVKVDDPEPPPPPQEPEEPQRGAPRVQYARTYWLLPQNATREEAHRALDLCYESRGTLGFSADDAGIGDLDNREVVPIQTPTAQHDISALLSFFDQYYGDPLIYRVYELDSDAPTPPTGGDEPEPSEPQYTLPTRNLVGLHMQEPKTDWPIYYRDAHPAVYKAVDQLGMVIEAKRAYSDTLAVFRRYVFNDGGWVDDPDGPDKLLDIYEATFDAHRHNAHEEPLDYVDVIESVNETYAWDYDRNMRALDFDLRFADGARARFGHAVDAGILTIAIGNPPIEQVGPVLLEAARKSYEDGHWLAYHAYWTANGSRPDPPYLLQHLDYHAGRWMRWDDVFRSAGVYPRYYLGEGGIVYANDPAGTDFASGRGWKSCGPFGYYIQQLDLYNQMLADWNARHGNRCRGLTVFCYGGGRDWRDFDWEPGDLYALRDWAVTL